MDTAGTARKHREELPCIWVLSGVLSYRLCDRDYECDGCELYHALSGEGRAACRHAEGLPPVSIDIPDAASPSGQATSHLSHLLAGCRLYLDRPYRPPHFWLAETEGDLVTVGLDGSLLRMLNPIRRIVSPGVGLCLERDQPCGWIARDHMAVPLKMPVAGEVVESNAAFSETGEPCRLPEGEDWWIRVRPAEPLDEVSGVVRAEETLAWYAERLRIVKKAILAAVGEPTASAVGPVLADGGTPEGSLEGVLGKRAFAELIARIARG
jgi:glycine cleavage system H lipoate-binding protein